jgi:hypothetical protein
MARADDLVRALFHLQAAQRLLRDAFALRALAAVNKAIKAVEVVLSHNRPVQPRLALEAPDEDLRLIS